MPEKLVLSTWVVCKIADRFLSKYVIDSEECEALQAIFGDEIVHQLAGTPKYGVC